MRRTWILVLTSLALIAFGAPALAAAPTPLPFFAVAPCRIADTRSGSGGFMTANAPRSFPVVGPCGIAATARAVAFNFTVLNATGPGFLVAYPQGGSFPGASTLNYLPGETVANAAVVALAGGGIDVVAAVSGADVIIDVNGYFAPDGVVNSVNGSSGSLTLAAGSNVTITPSGNTLTIAATPGAGGPPTGPAGGGLSGTYPNPTVLSSSASTPGSIVSRDGTGSFQAGSLGLSGTLGFQPGTCGQPLMKVNAYSFAIGGCAADTYLGEGAGQFAATAGAYDSAVGYYALQGNLTGSYNSAFGAQALHDNTKGEGNTAVGVNAMYSNTVAGQNTAIGFYALYSQSYDNGGTTLWATANTAVGLNALYSNNPTSISDGRDNTGVGTGALSGNTTGSRNTAVGTGAGDKVGAGPGYAGGTATWFPNATGSSNTFLGHMTGATADNLVNCTAVGAGAYCDASNQVRIGDPSVTSIGGKVAWSTLSDARAKTDIRDLALGLDFVLGLRPVTYTLKRGNGRTDMGFLAQDVEALLGDRYNVVGVGGDPDRTRTLRYTDLIAPLVKAMQEQQAMLEARNARVDELERRLAALEERLAAPLREGGR